MNQSIHGNDRVIAIQTIQIDSSHFPPIFFFFLLFSISFQFIYKYQNDLIVYVCMCECVENVESRLKKAKKKKYSKLKKKRRKELFTKIHTYHWNVVRTALVIISIHMFRSFVVFCFFNSSPSLSLSLTHSHFVHVYRSFCLTDGISYKPKYSNYK